MGVESSVHMLRGSRGRATVTNHACRLFTAGFLAAAISLATGLPALAQATSGGAGGGGAGSGGAGGVSSATGPGGDGSAGGQLSGLNTGGGGGGGAGALGWSGGGGAGAGGAAGGSATSAGRNGGVSGGGGGGGGGIHGAVVTTDSTNSGTISAQQGGPGGSSTGAGINFGGGGGGAGGYGVVVNGSGLTYTNNGTISAAFGGAGGAELNDGHGGDGGDGGYGAYFTGAGTLTNTGTITGGAGGAGGNAGSGGIGGNGGAGGSGAVFSAGGTLTNYGRISGGNGAAHGVSTNPVPAEGDGGAGIEGSGLTITNSGSISGGLDGSGTVRANAITFTGGTNTLTLQSGYSIIGNVVAYSSADTLALGGSGRASFDVSNIGASAQYQGFGLFKVNGTGTWTLTGTTSATTNWTVSGGTLAISADGNLGAGTLALQNGTTLAFTAGGSYTHGITVAGDPTFDVASGQTVTQSGVIADGSSTGDVTKTGAGTLVFTAANTCTGGTTVSAGILQLGSGGSLATAGALTVNGGAFDLNGHTQTVGALSGTGGTVALGSGALTVNQATDTSYFGAISGTGSFTKAGSGTLIFEGVNSYTGGTTVSGGTLEIGDASHTGASIAGNATVDASGTLAGHGTIGGDVTNSAGGIVAPGGSIGTLTVSGNYTQGSSSTLQIEVSPAAASKLAVSGNATLAGTLKLVYEPGVYSAKTYNILSASSVSGTFATVSGTAPSGVSPSLTYSPTDVDLVLSSVTVAPTNDTIFTATGTSALLGGQQANASLLDHLSGLNDGTESDTFQTAFASFADTGAAAALAYAGPAKPEDNPLASLPQRMARIGGWFRGLGSFANLNGDGSAPGFNTSGGGFLAGIDRPVTDNLTAGVAGGYARTNLSEDGGSSGAIDTTRFALYGSYGFGAWALDATLGYAYDHFSNSRLISPVDEVASSSHTGHEFDAALQVNRRFDLGGLTVMPNAGLQYVHLYERGFDEAGASGFNLTVSSRNSDSVRPFIGARFIKPWLTDSGVHMALEADVAYSRELSDTPPSIVQVGGGSFTVNGLAPSHDQLSLGTGITARMTDRLALFADYHATLPTGNLTQQTVKAGLNCVF